VYPEFQANPGKIGHFLIGKAAGIEGGVERAQWTGAWAGKTR
jgi:hypothetical protein